MNPSDPRKCRRFPFQRPPPFLFLWPNFSRALCKHFNGTCHMSLFIAVQPLSSWDHQKRVPMVTTDLARESAGVPPVGC